MDHLEDDSRPAAPLDALAGAAAAAGARELLLAGDGRLPRADALAAVRRGSGLPVVACGAAVPGLCLARLLFEAGAARVAARADGVEARERLRLLAEVYGAARVDALLVVRARAPRDAGLAAAFGLAPRWEAAVPSPDGDVSGATGGGADPVALARAAREAGAGRILLQAERDGRLPPELPARVAAACGLPVLLVEPAAAGAPLYGVRASGPRPLPSSAA